jgi:pentapeptide repeat protein
VASDDVRWRGLLRGALIAVVVGLFFVGFGWFWWHWVPILYEGYQGVSQAERLTAITGTRAALLAGLVGVGAVGTFLLNSRVYRVTARTFEVTERGHLTDRYTKAIEQLGSEALDLRLGGIYALEQLATDSQRPQDQSTIVEVLSAFVRVRSQPLFRYRQDEKDGKKVPPLFLVEDRSFEAQALEYAKGLDSQPVDVAAAIKVLGRLRHRRGVSRGDLSHAYLRAADFSNANFQGANLVGATLEIAGLRGADFTGAHLAYIQMTGAWANDADFSGADLQSAVLADAHVRGAKFHNTRLFGAKFTDAKGMTMEQVQAARIDRETVLPDHLRDQLANESPRSAAADGVSGARTRPRRLTSGFRRRSRTR